MRRRVEQPKGDPIEDNDRILSELDRLNEKVWRLYSPKKEFPNYLEELEKKKERKVVKPRISEKIEVPKTSDSK